MNPIVVTEFNSNKRIPIANGPYLKFPNVQTCLAVVGQLSSAGKNENGELVGIHLTVHENNHPHELPKDFYENIWKNCDELYIVGGVEKAPWRWGVFNILFGGARRLLFICDTSDIIDTSTKDGGVTVLAQAGFDMIPRIHIEGQNTNRALRLSKDFKRRVVG